MVEHQLDRRFGGIRFPERREPLPGPLMQLKAALALESSPTAPPVLNPSTLRMMADLPPRIRTQTLQRRHARVLERLAAVWQQPRSLRDLFDDLIFEGAAGRGGMSFEAIVELNELKEYVMRVRFGERPSVWDEALGLV